MPDKKPFWRRLLGAVGWLFLLLIVTAVVWRAFIYSWAYSWGATESEQTMPLPGDEFGEASIPQHTFGLTINAPADEVWKWLVQIGQGRGGFYSYTFLENVLDAGAIRNTNEIRPEWQELKPGDTIRLARDESMIQLKVLRVDPARALVLTYWGAFVLEPAADGRSCRLLIRSRAEAKPLLRFVLSFTLDPIHFLMQRRMMLGIKEMAEAKTAAERPLIPRASDYIWFFTIAGSGLLVLIMLFARRRPGRLPTAIGLAGLLTVVLYRFPPVPLSAIALAVVTLLVLIWRLQPSRRPPEARPLA